jgi:hypothetical protein
VDHIPAGLNPELAQLWGMLDEVQSNQRESTPTPIAEEEAPDTNKGSREARAAIQRVELPGEQVVRPAQIESQPIPQPADATVSAAAPEASLIQRQQAPATGTGGPAAEANQPSGQPGKLDIDELARQVYAEVKRRLALEWERMRR